ncbi:MAG: DUF3008 domain-containing protein [Acidobacteria bacterium]|nr:MAG: DUF3008 domain-containing protein [Acidobacteriota bacterium]
MPSKSEKQRRLFAAALAEIAGKDTGIPQAKKIAKTVPKETIEEFARKKKKKKK